MTPAVLTLDAVSRRFTIGAPWSRRHIDALLPISLELNSGEMLAVVGESGSGKTTLARLCTGLIRPTSGTLTFAGVPFPRRLRTLRGKLAAVLQNPAASLNPGLTIGQSIAEPMRLAGSHNRRDRAARVAELLQQVGLPPDFANRYPAALSGGQRQRVAIARALSTRPQLIIFDEAVSALDVSVQAQVLNLISSLRRDVGFAGLFITHDLAVARYVADRVLVLRGGKTEAFLPSLEFYGPLANPYARRLQVDAGLLFKDREAL